MDLKELNRLARSRGWDDWEQMDYYEQMAERDYMGMVQALPEPPMISPPPPLDDPDLIDCKTAQADAEIRRLAKIDSREVYEDMTGVY